MSVLHESVRYVDGELYIDEVPAREISPHVETPVYVYSRNRIVYNLATIQRAFARLNAHVHYSAKANDSLAILKTVVEHGVGIDCVSAGEIYKALHAGVEPRKIVFAGVGKSRDEIRYALEQGIGWFNVENVDECRYINNLAVEVGQQAVRIALRLNPEVTAETHPYIATGHGGAKFGLTRETIAGLLANQSDYPNLDFAGIHIHIGSQLGNFEATQQAVQAVLDVIAPFPKIRTINIGGGLPIPYRPDDPLPDYDALAQALRPLLADYTVLLEPGRSIVGDAGLVLTQVLYVKEQAGHTFYIVDASMTELIRPALYQAHHEIVPVHQQSNGVAKPAMVVGPVCETTDVLGRDVMLPELQAGDLVAILTAGAYGQVMASNYNARPLPVEVMVDGDSWTVTRQRQVLADLLRYDLW